MRPTLRFYSCRFFPRRFWLFGEQFYSNNNGGDCKKRKTKTTKHSFLENDCLKVWSKPVQNHFNEKLEMKSLSFIGNWKLPRALCVIFLLVSYHLKHAPLLIGISQGTTFRIEMNISSTFVALQIINHYSFWKGNEKQLENCLINFSLPYFSFCSMRRPH